jgi:hypothetical protein
MTLNIMEKGNAVFQGAVFETKGLVAGRAFKWHKKRASQGLIVS